MPQQVIKYSTPHRAVYAENKSLYVNSGNEVVSLDEISTISYNKFGLTITNSSLSSSPITVVNIYGSEDQSNYYLYKSNVFPGGVGPGATMHYEFTTIISFMRVTTQSTGLSNVDVYLVGNMGGAGTSNADGYDVGAPPGTPGTGLVQSGIIQFVNTDTANVTLSLPYADTNYAITLTAGDYVLAVYDKASKTGAGFTAYVSCPFTGEVSYKVAHP